MQGRFLSIPLMLCAVIISRFPLEDFSSSLALLLGGVVFLGIFASTPSVYQISAPGIDLYEFKNGIANERLFYLPNFSLLSYERGKPFPMNDWRKIGTNLKYTAENEGMVTYIYGSVGIMGYYASPKVHIIDYNGVTDPLLARLPADHDSNWRIGHFRRNIPEGCESTYSSGHNQITDTNLGIYFEHLEFVINGDLFDPLRLVEIVRFNLGVYDDLLHKYLTGNNFYSQGEVAYTQINQSKPAGTPWNEPGNLIITSKVTVRMDRVYHPKAVEIGLDNNDTYRLVYFLDDKAVGNQIVSPSNRQPGLETYQFSISPPTQQEGINRIVVIPEEGDNSYSLGFIILVG
jgi:arabinofuranosyltransferase